MGKIMESVFCAAYLVFTGVLAVRMLKSASGNKPRIQFGLLTLTLVCGDAFHLIPRIYGTITDTSESIYAALGLGTLVTSVTMTVFYVMLWEFWREWTKKSRGVLSMTAYAAAVFRVILCLFPQNAWLSENPPLSWGIYRNIPFIILGGIVAWQLFKDCGVNNCFKYAWLAVVLSFLFYIPVVLFADTMPIIGMLMIPKTICYVWLVLRGYKLTVL